MVFDELFQSLQQFLTQFVPGYVFIKTFHFFNKQKYNSFEGTAVASIAISYVINLVVNLFVKTDNSCIWISEVIAVVVAFIFAICIVKIKTMDCFRKCSQWIGKKSDSDNIWEELFDVNKGSTIRCYAKFKNEDAMITGAIKYYDVRDDGECDIVLTGYAVTYNNGNVYKCENGADLYLNSKNIHGLEVVKEGK
jgi:hypothetical protein